MASIKQQGKNSYKITVSVGYDASGKKLRKYKTVTIDPNLTQKQAEKELNRLANEFELEIQKGLYLDAGRLTFSEFIDEWISKYAEKYLAPKTVYRYKEIIDTRIKPSLGHLKIQKIQPRHIIEFCDLLREDGIRADGKKGGLSDRTILHQFWLLSSILTTAAQWQIIMSNPCERVKPPRVEKKEARHYNENEAILLLKALEEVPLKYKVIITLTIYTGLREGELMELQ